MIVKSCNLVSIISYKYFNFLAVDSKKKQAVFVKHKSFPCNGNMFKKCDLDI